jgi:hypothetical protein
MMKFRSLGAAVLSLAVCQGYNSASASAGELNVQGGTSTGGNAHVISGSVRTGARFSTTGAFNDTVVVRDCFGREFAHLTIRELATLPASRLHPLIRYHVLTINGETRVMLGVANPQPIFNGGSVTLRRGGVVIDSDPIVIH